AVWVDWSNIQTIGKAGEWGMGALGFTFISPEAARAWVHKYYNNLLNNPQKLTDYPANPNVAMVSGFMCAATDAEAEAKAAGWTFFIFALSYYVAKASMRRARPTCGRSTRAGRADRRRRRRWSRA